MKVIDQSCDAIHKYTAYFTIPPTFSLWITHARSNMRANLNRVSLLGTGFKMVPYDYHSKPHINKSHFNMNKKHLKNIQLYLSHFIKFVSWWLCFCFVSFVALVLDKLQDHAVLWFSSSPQKKHVSSKPAAYCDFSIS